MKYISGNLILKHLMQECSETEKQDLAAWLNESNQNQQTYNYFEKMMMAHTA